MPTTEDFLRRIGSHQLSSAHRKCQGKWSYSGHGRAICPEGCLGAGAGRSRLQDHTWTPLRQEPAASVLQSCARRGTGFQSVLARLGNSFILGRDWPKLPGLGQGELVLGMPIWSPRACYILKTWITWKIRRSCIRSGIYLFLKVGGKSKKQQHSTSHWEPEAGWRDTLKERSSLEVMRSGSWTSRWAGSQTWSRCLRRSPASSWTNSCQVPVLPWDGLCKTSAASGAIILRDMIRSFVRFWFGFNSSFVREGRDGFALLLASCISPPSSSKMMPDISGMG